MTVTIEEEDRQAIVLALACLSLLRPGMIEYCRSIAEKHHGGDMFDTLREWNSDLVQPTDMLGVKGRA